MSNYPFSWSITKMWHHLLEALLLHGKRIHDPARPSGSSREIVGWSMTMDPMSEMLVSSESREPSLAWACMETLWYLSLDNDVRPLLLLAPSYARFQEPGTTEAHGGYGRRLMHNPGHDMLVDGRWSQLGSIYKILTKDPNSRQAVVTLWDSADLALSGARKDIPCTLSIQFFVRQGALEVQVSMRSNDAWIGFIYDVFAYRVIQRLMADALGLKVGMYHHVVGSMHLYEKNVQTAEKLLTDEIERGMGNKCIGALEANPRWKLPMSPDQARGILLRNHESEYDALDALMKGSADQSIPQLETAVECSPSSWFGLMIDVAARGCLEKALQP